MEALKVITIIAYILICIALVVVVLMQEGKSAGLGSISGAADTYWGKNKGRTMDGAMNKITIVLSVAFVIISALLNMGFWK
ncbi:preprotein translocase subunit SecG [Bacteroides sp. Phil13]|uniref:preprotein translocase subunit SecG n=1 Tax=Bacteroides sp. Phil13 TaxID=1929999 RepID=UPI000B0EC125|nr:preprotein translocase subunit SecG [Bacteroides sp. Phil13]